MKCGALRTRAAWRGTTPQEFVRSPLQEGACQTSVKLPRLPARLGLNFMMPHSPLPIELFEKKIMDMLDLLDHRQWSVDFTIKPPYPRFYKLNTYLILKLLFCFVLFLENPTRSTLSNLKRAQDDIRVRATVRVENCRRLATAPKSFP